MTKLITRLGDRLISAFVPQEKAEAAGGCQTSYCVTCYPSTGKCIITGTQGYDPVHGTYCWRCPR
ncbi:hypothetical protein [Nonomuraea helvata]|uniref:Uncharacterized protein n=1 Tax=Nonomuraea helvata TaxID=37484 RepID=A0ABV5SIU3_9ACTN